jgi:hypothetical protein
MKKTISLLLLVFVCIALAAGLAITKHQLNDALTDKQNWEDLSTWMADKDKTALRLRDDEISKLKAAQSNSQVAAKF